MGPGRGGGVGWVAFRVPEDPSDLTLCCHDQGRTTKLLKDDKDEGNAQAVFQWFVLNWTCLFRKDEL